MPVLEHELKHALKLSYWQVSLPVTLYAKGSAYVC